MQKSEKFAKEILDLEKKYWTAMQEHDLKSAMALTDFPCLVAGAHGAQFMDREAFIKLFASEQMSLKNFSFSDEKVEVRHINPETAIIAYRVRSTFVSDGQDKTIDAIDTSTWIKKRGKWVCSMHTETELH